MATPFKPRPGGFKPNSQSSGPRRDAHGRYPNSGPKRDDGPRVNNEISAPNVRVVGDNVENQGVVSLREALAMAEALELDLVEISPNADPPVCKIIDYQKFIYQQKKKAKEMKANASKIVIKEIRFGPNTDEHDYQFKLKHAQSFLEEGSKVKAYVFFKGRSILFSQQGEKLLLRFALELEEYGKAEQLPKLEGKRMIMMLSPSKKK
ncbi:MAG: translation initiation factor IF-3 [Bacteroidales bacterium]|nr:translation initiation factor IF-3 [Bacteroidales bacterium]MBP6454076.1 translation initiation factor IF-3 [Bacteroidales bacterium]MBP8677935.1 translation initiation factor IF-3 [Bacteroidales bacterium]MBP9584346.1 translation initiation factor IF-3 [Bacteroidales bacterium]MBP9978176.1 translation initiation factor IF-3 [Bacteroidales bacterium]